MPFLGCLCGYLTENIKDGSLKHLRVVNQSFLALVHIIKRPIAVFELHLFEPYKITIT